MGAHIHQNNMHDTEIESTPIVQEELNGEMEDNAANEVTGVLNKENEEIPNMEEQEGSTEETEEKHS
eukprot:7761537-Ditylum_brightwellii.AAC.2